MFNKYKFLYNHQVLYISGSSSCLTQTLDLGMMRRVFYRLLYLKCLLQKTNANKHIL